MWLNQPSSSWSNFNRKKNKIFKVDGKIKRLISYTKAVNTMPAYELLLKVPQHFCSSLSRHVSCSVCTN